MGAYDEQIGRNLRRLREELTDSDPDDVALRMRLRGWDWTVEVARAVEAGTRPLLRDEAEDLMRALGYSLAFITMRTDAESAAEVVDHLRVRQEAALREAVREWWEIADRAAAAGVPVPTVESVVADGRRAASEPESVIGVPDGDDRSMLLSTWEDLAVRPPHPFDTVEVGVPWDLGLVRLSLAHDLREASDALRYATVRWLRADERRAPHWPGEPRTSPEQLAADERGLSRADAGGMIIAPDDGD